MQYECKIETRPAQPTVTIRTRTPVSALPTVLGDSFGRVMAYVGGSGAQPAGAPFVAYHNMDMDDLDIEAGFPIDRALPGRDDLVGGEIAAGDYVTCVHAGPYDQLGAAYNALTEFAAQQRRTPTGVAYEFYLNSPVDTPPAQLQTMILFALA